MIEHDSQSLKEARTRLSQSQSTSAELVAGVLAILLLAASVINMALPLQAGVAAFTLLASASIAVVGALVFFWLRLRVQRAAVARDLAYLEKSEARLAGIIRSSMEAIISVDDVQRIVLFNPMAETLFGCPACNAIGRPLSDFIPERFRAAHEAHVRRFGLTGVSERLMGKQRPLFALHTDGREFPIEASISQIEVNGGTLFTVMLRDTTERVRAEAALRRSQEELQHLSDSILATREEERHRIARELHDDLGQRLSALKMDISLLAANLQAEGGHQAQVDQTQAMQHVIDETIAAVRQISADLRPPLLDELGLVPSIEWIAKNFQQRFGLVVSVHAQEITLPERAAISVFRIVQEALNNVVRHADATRADISFSPQDEVLELSIQDDGNGWNGAPPAAGERKPLGLLGIRERARLLGGLATITHTSEGGAIKCVLSGGSRSFRGGQVMIRVMIADDHAVMRDGVRHILEQAGDFEIACEASDGTQVLQLVRDHSPQVIVLDLSMPGRSGLELLRQLSDDHPRVRVLVLTMHAEEQYVARAFRAGAAGYLTKESAATELVSALKKVAHGGTYVSPPVAEKLAHSLGGPDEEAAHTRLSDREMEVYRRLVHGEPLTEIATSLCVSAKTVSTYKMRLMDKLQLSSEASLVRYAIRHHLFSDDDTL